MVAGQPAIFNEVLSGTGVSLDRRSGSNPKQRRRGCPSLPINLFLGVCGSIGWLGWHSAECLCSYVHARMCGGWFLARRVPWYVTLPEWLRGWTANPLCSHARVRISQVTPYAFFFFVLNFSPPGFFFFFSLPLLYCLFPSALFLFDWSNTPPPPPQPPGPGVHFFFFPVCPLAAPNQNKQSVGQVPWAWVGRHVQ